MLISFRFPQSSHCGSLLMLVTCLLTGCSTMNGYVMNESGQAYYSRGDYAMAQAEFQKALMDDPYNASYAYNLASAMAKQGDAERAEQMMQHALTLNPSHQQSYHGLATMMHEQGRTAEAQQLLSRWAAVEPTAPEPHVELAWLDSQQGNYETAEQHLMTAIQANPRNEIAIAQMGQLYEVTGRNEQAVQMYQKSLYMNPGQEMVRSRLAGLQKATPYMGSDQNMDKLLASTQPLGMPVNNPQTIPAPQTTPLQTYQMMAETMPVHQQQMTHQPAFQDAFNPELLAQQQQAHFPQTQLPQTMQQVAGTELMPIPQVPGAQQPGSPQAISPLPGSQLIVQSNFEATQILPGSAAMPQGSTQNSSLIAPVGFEYVPVNPQVANPQAIPQQQTSNYPPIQAF